jgi:hypothetical protein
MATQQLLLALEIASTKLGEAREAVGEGLTRHRDVR